MLMNDKIIFDRYYCINSTKHCENEENICTLYFIIFLRDNAMLLLLLLCIYSARLGTPPSVVRILLKWFITSFTTLFTN